MNDVFNEVTEELKQDQLFSFFKKYGKMLAIALVIVLIAVASYSFWKSQKNKAYQAETQALITILNTDPGTASNDKKIVDLKALSQDKQMKLSYLVDLFILNAYGEKGQASDLDPQIEAIVNDANAPKLYADFGVLLKAIAALDAKASDQVEAHLSKLLSPENPWYFSATELMGFHYLQQKDAIKAATYFRTLMESGDTPNLIRERASQALAVIASQKNT